MRFKDIRSARIRTVTRRDTAVQTGTQVLPAPGDARRWVIDEVYYNTSVAGTFELKAGVDAAWSNFDSETDELTGTNGKGLVGGTFGANGGFVNVFGIECPVNQEIRLTTTGTTPTTYLVLSAHLEE